MGSGLPTEEEIRAFAERTGNLNDDGTYAVDRSRLAAGAQQYAKEVDASAEHEAASTAYRLRALYDEFTCEFGTALATDMIVAATPAVIRREGLNLRSKGHTA